MMSLVRHVAVVCAMVAPFPVPVCSQHPGRGSNGRQERSETVSPGILTGLTLTRLREKAEHEARKARGLRDGVTSNDLTAAIAHFQESVQLFHASHSDQQVAEATLEIG